ncbi:MAG TPA: MerR family transcriptional regulator [Terriglobia bacterium]
MSRFFHIHEFAELAGVTVKALRHYDRLGLLKPRRTNGGYRTYAEHDLERLEQIIALKFLGVPLRQIKIILDRPALELPAALRMQRKALEQKEHLLSRAVRAICVAEDAIRAGRPADAAILKKIIEVIDMQEDIEVMKKYYSTEEAWEKRRRFYEEGPSREWQELYRDVDAALGEDPASDAPQELADRWLKLAVRADSGDPELQTHSPTAWLDRENWPPSMKRRIAEFNLEEVSGFLQRAVLSSRKKYFSEEAWAKMVEIRKDPALYSVMWQSRVDIFREIESSLGEDPAGENGKRLAIRWMAHLDAASGGDPGVKAGLIKTWADRPNWTATRRWLEEALSMVTGERFDKAANFIDKAVASAEARIYAKTED